MWERERIRVMNKEMRRIMWVKENKKMEEIKNIYKRKKRMKFYWCTDTQPSIDQVTKPLNLDSHPKMV